MIYHRLKSYLRPDIFQLSQISQMQLSRVSPVLKTTSVSCSRKASVIVRAQEDSLRRFDSLAMAGVVSIALLGSAIAPEFLMPQAEAARSSGRAGGSSGFSARKSAPMKSQAAPA